MFLFQNERTSRLPSSPITKQRLTTIMWKHLILLPYLLPIKFSRKASNISSSFIILRRLVSLSVLCYHCNKAIFFTQRGKASLLEKE